LTLVMGASVLLPLGFGLLTVATVQSKYLFTYLLTLGTAVLSYLATDRLIPIVKEFTKKAGLCGKDINKRGTPAGEKDIPESLGIVPGTIFILINMIALAYTRFFFSHDLFIEHLSALLSVCFCVFLGFCDDVMDLKWRYKLILPTIASVPLLLAYSGVTTVVVPVILRPFLGRLIDLHVLYYVYMGSLAVFCTNAINIYAGINGLEVGQSIIIGCSIALHNILVYNLFNTKAYFNIGNLFRGN
jgi:UDP-N-acetylglucosamine--dolichyl-phosphate N-acetylglucosaminephosphotransferase